MKKAIAIIFLLLANIILLVHTFIPHHHCNQITICAESNHSDNECSAIQCDSPNHNNQDTSLEKNCTISNIFVRSEADKLNTQLSIGSSVDLPDFLSSAAIDAALNIHISQSLPFKQKPYLISFHSLVISRSSGLRAPPFC